MALKASHDDQALLLDLQALDTKLQQLSHRLSSLPEHAQIDALRQKSDAIRLSLIDLEGVRDNIALELKRVESDVALVEARIARDTERAQSSSSVKDIQAFEQELMALRKRRSDLEDIELSVMQRLEDAQAAVDEQAAERENIGVEIAAAESARDAAAAAIKADRSHAAANRATIAAKVPDDLLALYEKQRSRYGVGASMLRGGVSSASGVKLNESDMQVIRAAAADDVLLCPDSSAVLVRTNESGL